jgi:hypothetical protein
MELYKVKKNAVITLNTRKLGATAQNSAREEFVLNVLPLPFSAVIFCSCSQLPANLFAYTLILNYIC